MEEQPSHAKRKHYAPPIYAQLLNELTAIMNEVPKLRPDRDAWDIEGNWASTGIIHFVDSVHQPLFEPLRDFDCRTIKLVNPDRPAARITFYRKHRYRLLRDKDTLVEEKVAQIQAYIDKLVTEAEGLQSKLPGLPGTKQAETKGTIGQYYQQIAVWEEILANPEQYEIALSNYSRQNFYVTVNYKYRLPSGDYANAQEHLLNTQRDWLGNITQIRYNILFIDSSEILREHPYQNREIEGYLNGFPIQSQAKQTGRYTIYARQRPVDEGADSFGLS